jgi:hypothetical protein
VHKGHVGMVSACRIPMRYASGSPNVALSDQAAPECSDIGGIASDNGEDFGQPEAYRKGCGKAD